MKKTLLTAAMLMGMALTGLAQTSIKTGDIIRLYDGKAPGSESWTMKEANLGENGMKMLFNVSEPTLEVFMPQQPNGTAMVICPGGAFCMLSYTTEGTMVAEELNKQGITAFVLKYRTQPLTNADGSEPTTPQQYGEALTRIVTEAAQKFAADNGREPSVVENCAQIENEDKAFADADRAIALIRSHAAQWGLDTDKIGIIGFSAGAITSMHQTLYNTPESKPNFSAIIYGGWTEDCKLAEGTGPIYLCSPVNDVFRPDEALNVLSACREAKVPVEYHLFWDSQHGFGAVSTGKNVDKWIPLLTGFMKDVGFLR